MKYKSKQLSIIIAMIGFVFSASVFAAQSPAQIPGLLPYSGDYGAASIIEYLNSVVPYNNGTAGVQIWSGDVVTQINANTSAITTNTNNISINTTAINTLYTTTIPGINSAIANIYTNPDFNTAVGNYITADTSLATTADITNAISSANSAFSGAADDAVTSAIGTTNSPVNTAIENLYGDTLFNSAVGNYITLDTNLATTTDITNAISSTSSAFSTAADTAVANAINTPSTPANSAVSNAAYAIVTGAIASNGAIDKAISTANSSVNTAINTAVTTAINTVNNPLNNAVNDETTNAITDALSTTSNGAIADAISTATTPINSIVNGTQNNTGAQLTYGLSQHMGTGFWFANSMATLQTALKSAGAEALKNGNPQTVQLSGGTYTLNGSLDIPANVTLEGAGEEATYIGIYSQPSGTHPVTMEPNSILSNLTLQNTTTESGCATIYLDTAASAVNDNFTVSHVHLTGYTAFGFPHASDSNSLNLNISRSYFHIGALMNSEEFAFLDNDDAMTILNNYFEITSYSSSHDGACNVFSGFKNLATGLYMPANHGQTGAGASEAWQYCVNDATKD